jgi:hypothetical protein
VEQQASVQTHTPLHQTPRGREQTQVRSVGPVLRPLLACHQIKSLKRAGPDPVLLTRAFPGNLGRPQGAAQAAG